MKLIGGSADGAVRMRRRFEGGSAIEVRFRAATAHDRDVILSLLRAAALWLRERGIDYWQNWLAPPEHHVRWVDDGLTSGEFQLIQSAGSVIGCVRLQDADPMFWGIREEPAVYLHSLTIDRSLAGRGFGRQVLDAIGAESAGRGAMWLRLDCGESAGGLRAYYESCGFRTAGETVVDGEHLTLYQKSLTDS